MKSILTFIASFLLALGLTAQQQSSKSKSSDKLYEKGDLKRTINLSNAAGINTPNLDFSPAFYQNGIVYVSSRNKSGPVDKTIGETFFELFYAEFDPNGMPQSSQGFSLQVNSQVHEGPVSFSRDGNLMYFTRNNLVKGISKANSKGKVGQKVYEARRGKLDWEDVKELPFNNDEYACVHPTLSADGSRLFFSSDMPGGYGGMDLYYVEKRGELWSRPVNLGADINTTGNEVFPYLHESGTLFFSSNGRGGEGGLDIFMIDISGSDWDKLKNLGTPFNSAKDDLGFIINEEGTRGYLASDRPGGTGKDDIYMFEADQTIIEAEVPSLKALIVAYNEITGERISGASVRVFQRSADGFIEGNDLYDVQLLPSSDGDLVMRLVRKNDSELGAPALASDINGEAPYDMRMDKNYLLLLSKEGYQSAEMLYSTVGETKDQTIKVPMKPKSCTTVSGIVSVEGYGTKVPNALIRIVNEALGTEDLLRTNANGEFDFCLPFGQEFSVYAEKEGYTKGMSRISTVGTNNSQAVNVTVSVQPIAEGIMKQPIKAGSVIVLENIYYDFNQYFIRKGADRELDALSGLMKLYPSMEVELIAHTDSRGNEQYNLDLSLKRAESARRYLTQRGIVEARIKAFGYGESQLRNHCTDNVECTDEEHQYNRRTEVKITRIDEPIRVEYREGEIHKKGRG